MTKKVSILIGVILLFVGGYEYFIPKGQAEFILNPKQEEFLTELKSTQNDLVLLNNQLEQLNQEVIEKSRRMEKAEYDYKSLESEVKQVENDIKTIRKSIDDKTQILKERAITYKKKGMNGTYFDLLHQSFSFNDDIKQDGAVTSTLDDDLELLEQQEIAKHHYENKKQLLKIKLTELTNIQKTLIATQHELTQYQNQYKQINEQLKEKQLEHQKIKKVHEEYVEIQKKIQISAKVNQEYINTVINAGNKFIGNSIYVFGGGRNAADIANGRFDCSGFVHWAFSEADIEVGQTTDSLKHAGQPVPLSDLQPGDLVFFDTYKKDGHVGIYVGSGKFIGSQSSTGVAIADMTAGYWQETFNGRIRRI